MKGLKTTAQGLAGAFALLGGLLMVGAAQASEWGCTVRLCLTDPAGPEDKIMCKEPIKKLYEHLKKGKKFPPCDEAENMQIVHTMNPYDMCPVDTDALAEGLRAIEGAPGQYDGKLFYTHTGSAQYGIDGMSSSYLQYLISHQQNGGTVSYNPPHIYQGIGEGEKYANFTGLDAVTRPPKVCVGEQVGQAFVNAQPVGVYNPVHTVPAGTNMRAMDVYVDGVLYERVYW